MIEIRNKQDCCGCTACASSCPNHCITMEKDAEGFFYPIVDKSLCLDCRLCEKKCPVIGKEKIVAAINEDKQETNRKSLLGVAQLPQAYACFNNNDQIRERSTSGGVFTALAQYVIENKGVVCGVIIDDTYKVVHSFAENLDELEKMRGSKYVQSEQEGVYLQIKNELLKGRLVLYSGTPCQVVGLKTYLGREYERLITIDIFCHGVGSPVYWEKYVKYIQENMKSKIKEIRFREKTYGYSSACLAVYFQNGKSTHRGHDDDYYWSPFSKNLIYRPSCYACSFKRVNHVSDFSVGDYWKYSNLSSEFKESNGCSLVLCHSEKSGFIFNELRRQMAVQEVDLEEALNVNGGHQASMLITCPAIPPKRELWFADMENYSVPELVNKYLPLSLKQRIKCFMKPVLFKLGILDVIKKVMR